MNRNRLLVVVAMLCLAALLPADAGAQTTGNLAISANVAANCTLSVSPVAFGAYDPLGTHAATPLDATGGLTVTCTKGSVPVITIGQGGQPSASARQMANGTGGLLEYQLFQDSGHGTPWGLGADGFTALPAPSKTPRTFTVYGRVAAGLDPVPGTYGDTVLVTVTF
jgi:spore coat protein U-like protein